MSSFTAFLLSPVWCCTGVMVFVNTDNKSLSEFSYSTHDFIDSIGDTVSCRYNVHYKFATSVLELSR